MDILSYCQYISKNVSYTENLRIKQILPTYLEKSSSIQNIDLLYKTGYNLIKLYFPTSTTEKNTYLVSYLILIASLSESGIPLQSDAMNELSQMTSLRLQMTMDRRSKFINTLSNVMNKISSTQNTLTQNIK